MENRPQIVITGMGVIAPGAGDLSSFDRLIQEGRSAVRFLPASKDLAFSCQVGGVPPVCEDRLSNYLESADRRVLSPVAELAALAAVDCWLDAGLSYEHGETESALPDTGVVFGTGIGGVSTLCDVVGPMIKSGQARSLGTRRIQQTMSSGPAACVSGLLGIGGPCISVNAACSTGASALIQAIRLLRSGICSRVLAGSVEHYNDYSTGMFDAMRVLVRDSNDAPERASRPLSASAAGFVPAGGAGALMVETKKSAIDRGARIYAELAGGFECCGGQRSGGTMTRQSADGVVRCIRGAIEDANVRQDQIDYINGHLTSTSGDTDEIRNLEVALGRSGASFPWINSTKSLIGHTIGAAGSIESIATIIQIYRGFLHPSINCEDLHPKLKAIESRIPRIAHHEQIQTALKTSFGFGDVNACLLFRSTNS